MITRVQALILALMGAVYWFVAALIMRWTAAGWAGQGGVTALVFVLIIVGTVPALFLGMRVAGLDRNRAGIAATIMTATALLLDGVALTWGRSLYGSDPATVLAGAAAILWGAGVALVLGMMIERHARSKACPALPQA